MAKIHNPQNQDGIPLINQTIFNEEVNALKAADNAEALARKDADDELQANIDAEIERATTIESVLSTVIEDEIQRATQKDDELNGLISKEASRATGKENEIAGNLSQEIIDRENADTELNDLITGETSRATIKESELETSISAEAQRAQAIDNELIASLKHSSSTDTLTNNIYNQTVRQPSAINLHHSVLPIGKIKSIEIPNAGISTPYYLNIKVVDGTTDNVVDYTSINTSTTKWEFDNFTNNGFETDIYYKLVLTNTPAGTLQYFGASFPYNNINIKNCGFGGNWPEPNTNLNQESGVKGLAKINFEYLPSVANEVQSVKDSLTAEKEARIIAETLINSAISDEVERAKTNEMSIMSCINQIYTSIENRPETTVEAAAFEVKGTANLTNVIGKKIKAIEINVDNTVSTPHYLVIYENSGSGKVFKGVSSASTWEQGGAATFIFESPVVVDDIYEAYIINDLSQAVKPTTSSAPPVPSVALKMYARRNDVANEAGNYRNLSNSWNNGKYDFYLTYHFEAGRLEAIGSALAETASKTEVTELEARVNETISALATKEEIADFVTEETVDQKIAAVEHHKPIFDLERNIDRIIFDLSASSEPQSVTLTLSEGKIFAGSVVSSNSAISAAISAINPGVDTSLTINIGLQETPSESTDVFVIVDTICDSVEFNNAQHVAEVIPVQIIVPAVEETNE